MSEVQTAEQIAADAAAKKEAAAVAKAEAKAISDAAKQAAKEAKAAAAAEAKAAKEAAAADAKAAKQAEADAKAAAKAEAAKVAAESKAEAKVKVVQPQNNGVTRPRADGKCAQVWAIADSMSASMGAPVPISLLQPECAKAGLNDATCRTQYARWKTFNGVFGQVAKPAVAAVPEAAPLAHAA